MHQAQRVTFWVPTNAPQPLVTRPGSVSTFLSYHARGSPLSVALSWVVSVLGSPSGGVGTSRVRLPLTGTRTMALKPPFSSLYYCSEVLRPLTVSPPPRSFLPMGIGGDTVDALTLQRLHLATPHLGDASPWRRLILAMPHLGDALRGQTVDFLRLGPLEGSHHMLTLTLVNARGRDGTIFFLFSFFLIIFFSCDGRWLLLLEVSA